MPERSSFCLQNLPAVSVPETLAGGQGIVDIWCSRYDEIEDPAWWAASAALMSLSERARHERLKRAPDRRMFLAKRALIRKVLSRYAAVPSQTWCFAAAAQGKPFVAAPRVRPELHFSLSSTPGLAVCAISVAHAQLGVDAESIDAHAGDHELTEMHFAAEEASALRHLPSGERERRFFAYWTLKESHLKARGCGLAAGLDQIAFGFNGDGICASFGPQLAGEAAHWRFALVQCGPRHLIGLSVDTGGRPLSLRAAPVMSPGQT